MFRLRNNVMNIFVDEEHSVDELVELIKPCLASDRVRNRAGRLVYIADTCLSDGAFLLAMSLSKDLGLAVDLLHSSNNNSTTPVLIPEMITMNAAGISHVNRYTRW